MSSSPASSSELPPARDPSGLFLNESYVLPPLERPDNDSYNYQPTSPRSPAAASSDTPLLPDAQPRTSRPLSYYNQPNFVSSPLNPNSSGHTSPLSSPIPRSLAQSRQSMVMLRVASEESQALTSVTPPSYQPTRASMILYRLANEDEQQSMSQPTPAFVRQSVASSANSSYTISYDSKFPSGSHTVRKFVAYPFDPSTHIDTPEDDDALHDPADNTSLPASSIITMRGFFNIGVLLFIILALLTLFIFYPIWQHVTKGD